ncbi:hypothetical protein R1sor_007806 [Riccia sorocarpa]|uniref:Uncharacterized protein n=1 Tax=Riccia sorocarpa TaxID=122646 RepID=A0ABD3HRI6_9MARC
MEHVQYYLVGPWPDLVSVLQLAAVGKIPFPFPVNVLQNRESPGIIPAVWTVELCDYFSLGIEFACIEILQAGVTVGLKPRNLKAEARRKGKEVMPSTPSESLNPASPIPNDTDPQQSTPPNPARSRTARKPPIKKKQQRKTRRGPPVQKEISITIGQVGADIDVAVFNKLALFLEHEASMALFAFERGDTNLQLHIQGIVNVKTSSLKAFKADVSKAIGWDDDCHIGGSICAKAEKLWQMACSPDGVSAADVKEVYFSYVVPERYFSRSSHPGELQINRQTVTMKTPEYIPVNDEDEANPNRTPVATPNPGNPLGTRCGIVDIDSAEWHDQSLNGPQPETNQRNESSEQPAATNDDEEHVKEGNDEPMSLDVEVLQRALIPSPEYFLIERDELPDATESDIELLLNSNYAIGSGPKPYKIFEGKPYVWPDFIDLVRPL